MRSLNPKWTNYLINVGNGNHGEYENWSDLEKEFGIKITHNFEEAAEFYIKDVDLANDFPLDMQWIAPTNSLVDSTNSFFFEKRHEHVPITGKIYATTSLDLELDTSEEANRLEIAQKYDFVKNLKHKDIPDSCISFQESEPVCLLRNLNTREGIVKNKRCWIKKVMK